MERIANLQAMRDTLTDEQYEKMHDDVVREDEAIEYDEDEKEFRELYATICIDYLKKADQNRGDSTSRMTGRLPPTRPPDQSPLGPKTAFRSPSPGSSPLKSPGQSTVDSEEHQVASKAEEDHISGQFVKDSSTPLRDASPATSIDEPPKTAPSRTETRRSSARNEPEKAQSTAEKESSIHVVDSPAGRVRGARRPVAVESPLVAKSSARSSAGADVKREDVREDAKR
ncbi:unnamed protein product [Cylicostephanus goldi]|uniref:Uncharacterized protein n=1 Tax=Cylicostephanus goldi TaxID=71465 RepID=A0A3P7QQ02_CYLGO|nr:unnamed protein product [Cylicostephanus goldi]